MPRVSPAGSDAGHGRHQEGGGRCRLSIQQESQRKTIEITKANADIARREKGGGAGEKSPCGSASWTQKSAKQADAMKYKAEKEAEAQLIRRQREAEAQKYEALQQAEARKAEAEALRFPWSRRQRASGPRVWPRQRPLRRRQKPKSEWVKPPFWKCTWQPCRKWSKTPPLPLSQTEKIVMYGDGNSTKLVRDIIASANQVADGMRESTGIDLQALIAGFAGGKAAQEAEIG